MKRYEYEIELESPLEFTHLYSDTELTAKEIEKKVTERIMNRIDIYRVQKIDREKDENKKITEEFYEELAPGI